MQIVDLDYAEVVVESQKAMFNMLLQFSTQIARAPTLGQWRNVLSILEKQLNCIVNRLTITI